MAHPTRMGPLIAALLSALPAAAQDGPEIRAQLVSARQTVISSEVAARIDYLPAKEGQHFAQDEVLIRFDCTVQQAELSKARAALSGAGKRLAVNRRLSKLESISLLDVQLAEAEVEKAQAEVALNEAQVKPCVIKAPFAGAVVSLKAYAHQYVRPGQEIMEILDDVNLEVELLVPSGWLAWINTGTPFYLLVDELGKRVDAQVVRVGARIDPVSQSVKVMGRIEQGSLRLLPGMGGRAFFSPGTP